MLRLVAAIVATAALAMPAFATQVEVTEADVLSGCVNVGNCSTAATTAAKVI